MSETTYPPLARSATEPNRAGTLGVDDGLDEAPSLALYALTPEQVALRSVVSAPDGDDYTWDDDGFDGVDVREWPERMKDAIAALQDEIEQLWDTVRKQGEAIAALEAQANRNEGEL